MTDIDRFLPSGDDDHPVEPVPVALAARCWWIDGGEDWEITHHPTREEAVRHHGDQLRRERDDPTLSDAEALAITRGVIRQDLQRCWAVTCPECGQVQHIQDRFDMCAADCGWAADEDEPVLVHPDPDQHLLFDVLPTTDIPGRPPHVIVLLAEPPGTETPNA